MIYDAITGHLAFLASLLFLVFLFFLVFGWLVVHLFTHFSSFQLVGLWFVLSVGTLAAATVSPSSSPAENTKLAPASSSSHGAVYREARDYNAHESTTGSGYYRQYDRPQQSRCISCLYAAMTGNQDRDRWVTC